MSTSTTKQGTGSSGAPWGGRKGLLLGAIVLATALVTIGVVALLLNIFQHKQEAKQTSFAVTQLDDTVVDPAVWGRNFPLQYDMYLKTSDQSRTKFGGSEALPQTPSQADPRSVVAGSKLEKDPRLVQMWAGYAFSKDYREKRGHAYMLIDQRDTKRVQDFKQPGTCLNCHASMVKVYKDLGNGDMNAGFDKINHMTYAEATKLVDHPVACIDCHDPKTMQLRISRPAFMNGIKALKASQGIQNYDVNKQATTAEMRTFVCAQCHVEYYFKGKEKTLTFPWAKGVNLDDEFAYYQEQGFTDWEHKITGAPMLKAQHPEFEMWNQGVHAKAGVSCADCHMPYTAVGAQKVSDHQVRSPMLNVNRSCQVCHHASEDEMKARVDTIQTRVQKTRDSAFDALTQLIADIDASRKAGVAQDRIEAAQSWHRKASFYIDYVVSENSTGFHAPEESIRYLQEATDAVRKGQLALVGKEKIDPTAVNAFQMWKAKKAADAAAAANPAATATTPTPVANLTDAATPTPSH
ncbi:ammonia-forming cytochrome c nitrite reductase subunit c552 [Arsenicicoccus dermatophilus]|uniref:ammonia-forming cytochrome c nitrite reductase subunit c552 n=1 Tax=Arsenicicoccus dermatophilus TaxID=1076331 RepID=UPI001F4D191A|nr:ammonia-forming cytochrome c nitrite reductase subunit c552 [Arsenicicoccus dermatophilus]MCH8614160.1 ammonia-forming cytochrome c nitrite reductase subunit c552 [Arsenicicoccus dermatophilus]